MSSLSPVLTNIFTDWLEKKVFENSIKKPKLWVRYVDDTFVIGQHGYDELNKFHKFINNQISSVKCMLEIEKDRTLLFLDVLFKSIGSEVITEVYWKPTHSGLYINRNSNHPNFVKRGTIKTLCAQAKHICSNEQGLKKEIRNIMEDFSKNSYSRQYISKVLKEESKVRDKTDQIVKGNIVIPCMKGFWKKLEDW